MKTKKISQKARTALANGRIKEATAILGNYYTLRGTVVEGRKLGRTLGFPTANIKTSEKSPLFLMNGVYAVLVRHKEKEYKGMLNIGIRPTFEQHELSIEVNLFDFSDNLYGEELTLLFVDRIRDEAKFPNVEALKHQLELDKQKILDLLS